LGADRDQPCTAGPLAGGAGRDLKICKWPRQLIVQAVLGLPRLGSNALPVLILWAYAPYAGIRLTNSLFVLQTTRTRSTVVAMSAGRLSRNRSVSMSSGRSSKGRLATLAEISSSMPAQMARDFDPCAATASMFLYAQGNSVVCAHHDTLTIERRFSRHTEEIQLLAVDTVSERGAGRLVVSYDAGQTAIVWDCMTGDEIARFASYENLTVAAWMRNGNVAFGRLWY
jgi:hypothetical protein